MLDVVDSGPAIPAGQLESIFDRLSRGDAECGAYMAFITSGRAVLQVEYLDNQMIAYAGPTGTCAMDTAANFDGIVKDSSSSLQALPPTACR